MKVSLLRPSGWGALLVAGIILGAGLFRGKDGAPPPATAKMSSRRAGGTNLPAGPVLHVWDNGDAKHHLLISRQPVSHRRSGPNLEAVGDLWFRDGQGQERFIANEVISAKFSPDGSKIAYGTRERDLFVETVAGELLVQIPRAIDPSWRADSRAVWFLAVPSLDYPELAQPSSYDFEADAPP